jgi:hypothetical protein
MDEIAPEYDVIVLGTGTFLFPLLACFCHHKADPRIRESFWLDAADLLYSQADTDCFQD